MDILPHTHKNYSKLLEARDYVLFLSTQNTVHTSGALESMDQGLTASFFTTVYLTSY